MIPKVSVLMPVYNGQKYIKKAIESILNQTHKDFEFIILNDGSTDRSLDIINSFVDTRVKVVSSSQNLGLVPTLNRGIELARGEYIARMDADDISLKQRLEKQVSFMDKNQHIGVCGTWAQKIDSNGEVLGSLESSTGKILDYFFWRPSPFIHSSCLIRTFLLKTDKYNPCFRDAEDYELWLRLSKRTIFFNINEQLILYRIHSLNTTSKSRENQLANSYKAFSEFYKTARVDYETFISFMFIPSKNVNPFRRALSLIKIISVDRKGWGISVLLIFLLDSLRYLKLWLKTYVFCI